MSSASRRNCLHLGHAEAPAIDAPTTEDCTDVEESADWEEYQLPLGKLAAEDERLCPWQIIKKYPYYYIGNANRPKVIPVLPTKIFC